MPAMARRMNFIEIDKRFVEGALKYKTLLKGFDESIRMIHRELTMILRQISKWSNAMQRLQG